MKILLTGGTGFLGSHLLRRFLADNHEVILLKRSFSRLDRIKSEVKHRNIKLIDLDIDRVEDVFKDGNVTSIVHAATDYGRAEYSINEVLEANLVYPIKLVELGIKYGVSNFINTDSYFNKDQSVYSHLANYAMSKRNLLGWLHRLSDRIQITNVMLEHIYGPEDSDTKFVTKLIKDIAIERVARVSLTFGYQKRDFIYVDDVVNAYTVLLKRIDSEKPNYEVFQIGTGDSISVRELAESIKFISLSKTTLGFGDIKYRNDEIMDSKANNLPLIKLGWQSTTSLKDGLVRTINSYNSGIGEVNI